MPSPTITPTLHKLLRRELAAVRRSIEAYPDEASVWAERPGLPNTGGNLALHLAGNLQHFFGAVLAKTGYVRDRDSEFSRRGVPRAELIEGLDAAGSWRSTPASRSSPPSNSRSRFQWRYSGTRSRRRTFSCTCCRISATIWASSTTTAASSPATAHQLARSPVKELAT